MKTDKQIRNEEIQKYLIESLDFEGYDNQNKNWANWYNIFMEEQGYNIERIGEHNAIKEYLLGLGGAMNIYYTYFDISNFCYNRLKMTGTKIISYPDGKREESKVKSKDSTYNSFYWEALTENILYLVKKEKNELIKNEQITKL